MLSRWTLNLDASLHFVDELPFFPLDIPQPRRGHSMPPRLPFRTAATRRANGEPYVCASCLLGATTGSKAARLPLARLGSTPIKHRSIGPAAQNLLSNSLRRTNHPTELSTIYSRRQYSSNASLASVTAINAPSTVPSEYRALHQDLNTLQEKAGGHVDLSRLQLAVRSLETNTPTIRVALLGLGSNGALAARKLARVLLSDPLADVEAWEKQLLETSEDGRSLLLRYGDVEDAVQHSPLIQTVHIPSPFLQRNNVEILVSTLNANGKTANQIDHAELEEAILVPPLTIPTSAGGRVGFVRYPVHKALIVAEGINGAVEYGRFPESVVNGDLINAALSLPLQSSSKVGSKEQAVSDNVVDIDLATHALDIFRESNANGAEFSSEWQTSRVPAVSSWIASGKNTAEGTINPTVKSLLESVLSRAAASVTQAESEQVSLYTQNSVQDSKREEIITAIAKWSADAHRDLQVNLHTAFLSKSWHRTVWWRLLWRIDDVSFSAADILRLSWLTEAEQNVAYLSGRIAEAGLATPTELKESTSHALIDEDTKAGVANSEAEKTQLQFQTVAELLQTPTMMARVQEETGINPRFDPPWPQTINLNRQHMLHGLVPDFHRKAQALLLSTLTTMGGTTALGAWLYVATSGVALYEAGAILSLGVVWSLRRLQKLWGKERDIFESSVKEDARKVLAEVEGHLEKIAREGGRAQARPEDTQSWEEARAAVQQCQKALAKIQ